MTPTAEELWNDVDFCKKRWLEQIEYLRDLAKRNLHKERFDKLFQSAYSVKKKFYYRYLELSAKQDESELTE